MHSLWRALPRCQYAVKTTQLGRHGKERRLRRRVSALCAVHSASRLTRPAKTLGNAAAAGTMRERSGAYALACSSAAVSTR